MMGGQDRDKCQGRIQKVKMSEPASKSGHATEFEREKFHGIETILTSHAARR
jgi:hypothetical protein